MENTFFAQDSQIWNRLRVTMPDSLGEAVKRIMEEKGLTQMELALRFAEWYAEYYR